MIDIKSYKDCCGCTACVSICSHNVISLRETPEGFMYPNVDQGKCVHCGLCLTVCPLLHKTSKTDNTVKNAYALRHKNADILYNSSSGGAFFALVQYVISAGGMVFGAVYDESMHVVHTYSTTLEGCYKFQGSKYSQSNLAGIFEKVKYFLKEGKIVLFSGTPCQNHGLLLYLKKKYDNLITVDIICHSVPSPRIFTDYIGMIQRRYNDIIINVSMRDKTLGWGTTESYRYYFKSGKEILNPKGFVGWQHIFESGLITRESCFDCHYTNLNRVTDFTIGDFWDIGNLRPELRSKSGTSILLVNTEKAQTILNHLRDSLYLWPVTESEYLQPRLQEPSKRPNKYDDFWDLYHSKGFKASYNYFFPTPSILKRLINKIIKYLK